LNIIALPPS